MTRVGMKMERFINLYRYLHVVADHVMKEERMLPFWLESQGAYRLAGQQLCEVLRA